MPNFIINGIARNCAATTIPDVLKNENMPEAHWQAIAVACNGKVIRRADWQTTLLNDGDAIEIVKPFVGG
jgi:sulfur carrier protein